MSTKSNVIRDERMARRLCNARKIDSRAALVNEVANRNRVVDLAGVLGIDRRVIADVLVHIVDTDPTLRDAPQLHHAA